MRRIRRIWRLRLRRVVRMRCWGWDRNWCEQMDFTCFDLLLVWITIGSLFCIETCSDWTKL